MIWSPVSTAWKNCCKGCLTSSPDRSRVFLLRFGELTMARLTWKNKGLAAPRGTQFGAIIRCALGVDAGQTVGPRFVGKATKTSDGYVLCDFITRDGQYKMKAFVGSFDDF